MLTNADPTPPPSHDIDPEAAAAVLGTTAAPEAIDPNAPEENIYDVMKQHIRRKQEEQEAKYAQQTRRPTNPYGRPQAAPPASAPAPVTEKVSNLADLPAVWAAARNYLSLHARLLESVLGNCTNLTRLAVTPPEATLEIPDNQSNFTNDKAKVKLEEALRTVTGLPLKLTVTFVESAPQPSPLANTPGNNTTAAQRVPPEIVNAVNAQPLIQQLQQRLDATITQIEILGSTDE